MNSENATAAAPVERLVSRPASGVRAPMRAADDIKAAINSLSASSSALRNLLLVQIAESLVFDLQDAGDVESIAKIQRCCVCSLVEMASNSEQIEPQRDQNPEDD